jgi:Tfp pilus assembly protein FimT
MATTYRSFASTRLLLVLVVLAILAVVLVLAAPHLLSVAHGISFGSHPLACGGGAGPCPDITVR